MESSIQSDRNDDPSNPFGGYRLDGTYVFGPAGMRCVLAVLIGVTWLAVSASTPEGERKQRVTYRGREAQRRREMDGDEDIIPVPPKLARIGGFYAPRKPATSGRKRRAA